VHAEGNLPACLKNAHFAILCHVETQKRWLKRKMDQAMIRRKGSDVALALKKVFDDGTRPAGRILQALNTEHKLL